MFIRLMRIGGIANRSHSTSNTACNYIANYRLSNFPPTQITRATRIDTICNLHNDIQLNIIIFESRWGYGGG